MGVDAVRKALAAMTAAKPESPSPEAHSSDRSKNKSSKTNASSKTHHKERSLRGTTSIEQQEDDGAHATKKLKEKVASKSNTVEKESSSVLDAANADAATSQPAGDIPAHDEPSSTFYCSHLSVYGRCKIMTQYLARIPLLRAQQRCISSTYLYLTLVQSWQACHSYSHYHTKQTLGVCKQSWNCITCLILFTLRVLEHLLRLRSLTGQDSCNVLAASCVAHPPSSAKTRHQGHHTTGHQTHVRTTLQVLLTRSMI
jgi:hypothetical protein